MIPWLSILTFLPVLGALLISLTAKDAAAGRRIALLFAAVELFLGLGVGVRALGQDFRFVLNETVQWAPALGVSYRMGVDGIAVWLIVLVLVLTPVALVAGPNADDRKSVPALILLLQGAMIGAFCSLDLLLFFTFFELTLLPMYFLISAGGASRSREAAGKFVIYTFAGSIFLFVAAVGLALRHQAVSGTLTFSLETLQASVASGRFWAGTGSLQGWLFWGFAIAFLVKAPAFPFHTWIPSAYGEAKPAVPIVSSAMVKLGTFGLLRFCAPLFPDAFRANAPILAGLGVAGILYGAIVAAVQTDMRRMLAYSTLSHMGFLLLGIASLTPAGLAGAAYGQLAHGITAAGLLVLVGWLATERGSYDFRDYGGVKAKAPVLAFLFLVAMLGSVGLPGTIGFVGEFLALFGGFQGGWAGTIPLVGAILAGAGVVFAAVYLLTMFQRIFTGPAPVHTAELAEVRDPKGPVAYAAGAMAALTILGGVASPFVTLPMTPSLEAVRTMATDPSQMTWSDVVPQNVAPPPAPRLGGGPTPAPEGAAR